MRSLGHNRKMSYPADVTRCKSQTPKYLNGKKLKYHGKTLLLNVHALAAGNCGKR